jgi:hypothetical protein
MNGASMATGRSGIDGIPLLSHAVATVVDMIRECGGATNKMDFS